MRIITWEYKHALLEHKIGEASFEALLNRAGAKGWELIVLIPYRFTQGPGVTSHKLHAIFKRPVDYYKPLT